MLDLRRLIEYSLCMVCGHKARHYDMPCAWYVCDHCGFIDEPDERSQLRWPERARYVG